LELAFHELTFQLSVRGRNKKELVGNFFKRFTQSADEILLSGQVSLQLKSNFTSPLFQKDVDNYFEQQKNYLVEYHTHVKEATAKSDKTCRLRRSESI
jgi:sorting nexin-5/6/32